VSFFSRNRRELAALKPLRDIDGVLGAVVWDTRGKLLAQDLPELWRTAVLREVGIRVAYLCASFSGDAGQFTGAVLAFAHHRLQLRVAGSVLIGVLMSESANTAALHAALHITARHFTHEVAPQPRAQPAAPNGTPALAAPTEGSLSARVRMYRGRSPE
jgi:hypothetical protein